jgi:hypothetical protein
MIPDRQSVRLGYSQLGRARRVLDDVMIRGPPTAHVGSAHLDGSGNLLSLRSQAAKYPYATERLKRRFPGREGRRPAHHIVPGKLQSCAACLRAFSC